MPAASSIAASRSLSRLGSICRNQARSASLRGGRVSRSRGDCADDCTGREAMTASRRRCVSDTGRLRRPYTSAVTAMQPAMTAISMDLDLDVHDLADDENADHLQRAAYRQKDL